MNDSMMNLIMNSMNIINEHHNHENTNEHHNSKMNKFCINISTIFQEKIDNFCVFMKYSN